MGHERVRFHDLYFISIKKRYYMKILNKFENVTTRFVQILFGIIIFLLLINSIIMSAKMNAQEYTTYYLDNIVANLISIALLISITVLLKLKKIRISKKCIYIGFTILGILCAVWIAIINLSPISDQWYVLECAMEIIDGNFESLETGGYLYIYPQQYGLTILFIGLVNCFGNNAYLAVQIINIFALLIAFYSIYRISKILYKNNEVSKYVMLALIAFIPISMYITFVYGNLIGLALSCLAILFQLKYLESDKKRYIIFTILFSIIAVHIKSNYLINLVGIVILFLVEMVFKKKIKYIIPVILIIVCYFISTQAVNLAMKKMTNIDRNKGTPTLTWVAMGLQEGPRAEGWYNGYNLNTYVDNDYDYEKSNEIAKENIKESLNNFKQNPQYAIKFFENKNLSQWNNPTFQCIWINLNRDDRNEENEKNPIVKSVLYEGVLSDLLIIYADRLQTIILFGTFLYIFIDFKKLKLRELIFAIIFLGGFIFHTVWEAKGQYTISYFVLLIPYCIVGYNKLSNIILRKWINYGTKNELVK